MIISTPASDDVNIELPIISSMPLLNATPESLVNFTDGLIKNGATLCRSPITFYANNTAIKFDSRSWAFVHMPYIVNADGKNYNSIVYPLFSVPCLFKLRNEDATLNKNTIRRFFNTSGINFIKPESSCKNQGYAHLLTEGQAASIIEQRPIDFDIKKYTSFCSSFTAKINSRYGDTCLPVFYLNKNTLISNYHLGFNVVTLNNNAIVSDSQNLDTAIIQQSSIDPGFLTTRVVYCIRYSQWPNHFRIGYTCDSLITRLNDHADATGWKPIVVFAFYQTDGFTKVHPEQFELDLQQVVARDLLDTKYFNTFNLDYVRKCGDYGFFYNGSEADLTRICFTNQNTLFSNTFSPFKTCAIIEGNKI